MNTFNAEEMELLAAGYVLDDLDETERLQVEELIESSPAMREQIRQSMAVMGILATDAEPMSPPVGLKNKISSKFEKENNLIQSAKKNLIQLDNWFQQIFDAGWQTATELLKTPSVAPAFRNSGVEGAKLISIGSNNTPIILIVRVRETQESERDVAVEILPELEKEYLPSGLQLMLLDADGDKVMEAVTRQENRNLKFDFTGTCGETFSIKLELFDNFVREDFIL
jgi:anti-sigma-K factor RskA